MTGLPALTVARLDHVVLRVTDIDRALAFYTGLLGMAELRRVERLGLVQLRAGASMLDLVPGTPAPGPDGRNMDHVCFRIDPWDEAAIRDLLARHGIEAAATATRFGAEGDGPSIYISDPDGNTVELKGPAGA
ncbi:MAG: VOC family protein [Pseudomonadota bacterium]|nr:VOC family protein [Pseudomonadota bacterium]